MAKPKLSTAVKDLTINQGDDFRFQLKIKNHDNSHGKTKIKYRR
nr:MAG TPA: hypothetical protein [Caudoviricetes sp.]